MQNYHATDTYPIYYILLDSKTISGKSANLNVVCGCPHAKKNITLQRKGKK